MATLVAVPQFTTGETPSVAKLAQFAAAVSFSYALPALFNATAASTTVSNSTSVAIKWSAPATDRDGGWAGPGQVTRYVAQTPGYYDVTAALTFPSNVTGARMAFFQVTTGSGNPGGAGTQTPFGMTATQADGSANTAVTIGSGTPYLYLADYVEVYAWQDSGGTLTITTGQWQVALASLGP